MAESSRPLILVVDDDRDSGYMLEALLEADGYEVLVATSRAGARALLESRAVDVLLTDLALGDGSALDLLNGLLETARPRVAIVLSGFDAPSDIERSRRAGFHAHLGKPAPLALLRDVIATALRGEPIGEKIRR